MFDPRAKLKIMENGCVDCPFMQKKVDVIGYCARCSYNCNKEALAEKIEQGRLAEGMSFYCRFSEGSSNPVFRNAENPVALPQAQPLPQKNKLTVATIPIEFKGIDLSTLPNILK